MLDLLLNRSLIKLLIRALVKVEITVIDLLGDPC